MKKVIRSVFVFALIVIPAITNYVLADPSQPLRDLVDHLVHMVELLLALRSIMVFCFC